MTLLAPLPRRFLSGSGPYVVGGAFLGAVTGYAIALGGSAALAAPVAVLLVVVIAIRPSNMAIFAVVGSYGVLRVGGASITPGSSGGITYADLLLAGASLFGLAVIARGPELRRMRLPLIGLMIYLVSMLPTLLVNDTGRGQLEWAHRLVMVGGAMVVGAWIAREKLIEKTLRVMMLVSAFIAFAAVISFARTLHAATPFGLNKNFIGSLFAVMAVLVIAAPDRCGLTQRWRVICGVTIVAGLIASFSRGAILAAIIGVFIALLVGRTITSRWVRVGLMLLGLSIGVGVYISVTTQLNSSTVNTSGLGVRFNVERETRNIWRTSPIVGVGLKYFGTGKYGYYAQAANNVVDNELAESGVVGLVGFVVLQGTAVAAGVQRKREPFVLAGVSVVIGQLVHGQVDIYWAAGVSSLPFIIFGMALAETPIPRALGPDERPGRASRRRAAAARSGGRHSVAQRRREKLDARRRELHEAHR